VIGHLGFTGTRKGMTEAQADAVREMLRARGSPWLHHGLCVGADEQAHHIARSLGMQIEGHPPTDPRLRAWLECDVLNEPLPYRQRNHVIVDRTVELFAAPLGMAEEAGSGTWSTVRYARSLHRLVTIIWPDGTLGFSP
jgi:hypothetical protein